MNQPIPNNLYPFANGLTSSSPFIEHFDTRDPTPQDTQFQVQQRWWNKTLRNEWVLTGFTSSTGIVQAVWEAVSSSTTVETLQGNTGGPVGPDVSNNIHVIGDTTTINIVGTPLTNTLTVSATGAVATSYVEDSGTAVPSAGVLNVKGGTTAAGTTPVSTLGSGNTVTVRSQISQAIASTDATKIGLSAFKSTQFSVDANGFVSLTAAMSSVVIQTFTISGTYTPTSGMKFCIIECVGGGGGSGAANAGDASTNASASAGGGGGEYARGVFSAATIGVSQTVTIGAGGTAGIGSSVSGGTGGTTSVGILITALGGVGSSHGNIGNAVDTLGAPGGSGGTGGSFHSAGGSGTNGQTIVLAAGIGTTSAGTGGSSSFGGGGSGGAANATASLQGTTGGNYGGGAGGSANYTNAVVNGAAGGPGLVVITEYIL